MLHSGTSDSGHSEERTTFVQWTNRVPPANNCMHVRTSEEGTTSEEWTKHSSPTRPLFGGSTVITWRKLQRSPVSFSDASGDLRGVAGGEGKLGCLCGI